MKKLFCVLVPFLFVCYKPEYQQIINTKDVTKIEKALAADDMQGRRAFSVLTRLNSQ
jgi:hypothetical protein